VPGFSNTLQQHAPEKDRTFHEKTVFRCPLNEVCDIKNHSTIP